MKRVDNWSLVFGIFMVAIGCVMLMASFFIWPIFFYALPILIIGIVTLATLRQQEYIEPIKESNKKSKEVRRR